MYQLVLAKSENRYFYAIVMNNDKTQRTLIYKGINDNNNPSISTLLDFLQKSPSIRDNIDVVKIEDAKKIDILKVLLNFNSDDSGEVIWKIKESCIEEFL